ncbi:MAG: class II aldolase/adducin family protein, partial [Bacteroidetes bacterium]
PQNKLWCRGPVSASSESLTHAAVYQADPGCQAVIHVHHRLWWEQSLDRIPTTSASAPYGSPEMAEEVMRLFRETDVRASGVFVMAGHEEGLVAFGPSLPAAVSAIVNLPARL